MGTVFRISTNGTFNLIFSFNHADGASPAGALIQASDGWLYGTTSSGGNRNNYGTVFKMSTSAIFNAIYLFTGGSDGSNPNAGLVQASDGSLYGTASGGGNSGNGTVFKITTNAVFTPMYSFTGGNDGANPDASLIQASDGSIYGTASGGGSYGNGTVFNITTNGAFNALFSFFPTFQAGFSGALAVSGGNFYGTTQGGGANGQGSIIQLATNGALTTLFSFPGGVDGENPIAGLLLASDGWLYGTTEWGGTNGGYGTVFQSSTNGAFASIHSFNSADGANRRPSLSKPATAGSMAPLIRAEPTAMARSLRSPPMVPSLHFIPSRVRTAPIRKPLSFKPMTAIFMAQLTEVVPTSIGARSLRSPPMVPSLRSIRSATRMAVLRSLLSSRPVTAGSTEQLGMAEPTAGARFTESAPMVLSPHFTRSPAATTVPILSLA